MQNCINYATSLKVFNITKRFDVMMLNFKDYIMVNANNIIQMYRKNFSGILIIQEQILKRN